jgi:hypothetical protein
MPSHGLLGRNCCNQGYSLRSAVRNLASDVMPRTSSCRTCQALEQVGGIAYANTNFITSRLAHRNHSQSTGNLAIIFHSCPKSKRRH